MMKLFSITSKPKFLAERFKIILQQMQLDIAYVAIFFVCKFYIFLQIYVGAKIFRLQGRRHKYFQLERSLRRSATQNCLIFQLCFIMPKIKLYVCRILCENFIQIGQKMKKL